MSDKPMVSHEKPHQGATNAVVVKVATEREAKAASIALKVHVGSMRVAWFELGQMVRNCLQAQVPAALGMTAIEWLREYVGESVSTVYRALRIVKALESLPEDSVKQLSEGQAYQLTRLPPKEREEWMAKALEAETTKSFQQSVEAHIHAKTGLATEPRVTVSVSLEESVSKIWKEAEEKIARICELDIETRPGLRAQVFESIATLIMTTDEAVLRAEMVGDDGSEAPLGTQ